MEEAEFSELMSLAQQLQNNVKAYEVAFVCEVRRTGVVYATDEAEARAAFERGHIISERDVDCTDIELLNIKLCKD